MNQLLDRFRNRGAAFIHDLIMIPVAWLGAYWLRFNLEAPPDKYVLAALAALPLLMLVQASVFWAFGLYRGVWRFASLPDLMRILKAVLVGSLLSMTLLFILFRLEDVPRTVPLLFILLQLLLLAGPRLLYRWRKDRRLDLSSGQAVLVVGAGQAGEMLVRDMLRDSQHAYRPVAFVDDLPRRQGAEIHGVPVVGQCSGIPDVVREYAVDVIVLAIPSASGKQMRQLVEWCERSGAPFRTVPKLRSLMSGQVSIDQLKAVSIEDLLGRESVSLEWDAISQGLRGQVILVTGGGGSIGSELCRQIARLGPARLIVFDHSEFNLYAIEQELGRDFPELALSARLGDVSDRAAVEHLFAAERPQQVFHAAAYKHVPMLEAQVREALRVNVMGTRAVADAAERHGCGEFVLISTDKAVNPANVMGACKRLAEQYIQYKNGDSDTRFITVRFGNVLGSAGSVVPLFRRQIDRGGPLTVTHPDMERYFMTIPEACQLIMQAGVMGDGGEIFVLDMGEPVKIRYLAEQMIRLSGREPEEVPIEYIGLRPGEKLYEELFYQDEGLTPTRHQRIRVARHRQPDAVQLQAGLAAIQELLARFDSQALLEQLADLVPEWRRDAQESE